MRPVSKQRQVAAQRSKRSGHAVAGVSGTTHSSTGDGASDASFPSLKLSHPLILVCSTASHLSAHASITSVLLRT